MLFLRMETSSSGEAMAYQLGAAPIPLSIAYRRQGRPTRLTTKGTPAFSARTCAEPIPSRRARLEASSNRRVRTNQNEYHTL
jgi:hypothetical protein